MTDLPLGTADARTPGRPLRSAVRTVLGPLWVTTFRDPVRTGRLRLDGLSAAERHLARAGLVTLVLMLGSILFADVWRAGTLVPQGLQDQPRFVPEAFIPVAMTAAFLGLVLLVWGALAAAPSVRLLVSVFYVLTASSLMRSTVIELDDTWLLKHGQDLLYVAFWVPFGALVLSAALQPVSRRSDPVRRWALGVLRLLCLAAFAAMPALHLALDHQAAGAGFAGNAQSLLFSAFVHIENLLLPLAFVAAVAIVDFATDVSSSLAEPVRSTPQARWGLLRWGLLAVVLAKLWFVVGRQPDYWRTLVLDQPEALVRTALALAVLAAATAYAMRAVRPSPEDTVDEAKERLTLGGTVVLTSTALVYLLLIGLGLFVVAVSNDQWASRLAGRFPFATVAEVVPLVCSALAVVGGVWLIRRAQASARAREIGAGLLLLGAWNLPAWGVQALDLRFGFSYQTVDLAVTVGILAWLLARWRRVDAAHAALLLAVALFSWLVLSRGDYLSFLGGLLGLPAIVVVVFGVVYTLLSGSAFAAESSDRLPRQARTLMYVGYLLLSVTILAWQVVIHQPSLISGEAGFHYLGLPLAAWLLVRRIVPRQLAGPAGEEQPG